MNIFHLHRNPVTCAAYHTDKHVVKMRLELTQLLCTAHVLLDNTQHPILYKPTHKNHPCAIWVRQHISHYMYTVNLARALCNELILRYKTKQQKILPVLDWLEKNTPKNIPTAQKATLPPRCMPAEYKTPYKDSMDDVIESYRAYYVLGKPHLHKWTNREIPAFISNTVLS